ncbi:MAG: SEC-C metal-binding domain-containing protein [Bacilli bacterium]
MINKKCQIKRKKLLGCFNILPCGSGKKYKNCHGR